MKRFVSQPSDTVLMFGRDVTDAINGPVLSGLTGTLTVYNAANAVVTTASISGHTDDDWYAQFSAPATAGLYRMVMVMAVGGVQRTLEAELRVI